MSFAAEMSKLSDEANRTRLLHEAVIQDLEREAKKAELAGKKSEWPLERILSTIREHAGRGERSCHLNLFLFENAPPGWAESTVKHIVDIARSNGFTADYILDTLEPFGSDPLFDHTVYSGDVVVKW